MYFSGTMKRFLYSFSYAFNGIAYAFKTQFNFKVHVVAAVSVLLMGYAVQLSVNEWLWIVLAIALVMVVELINTAIEILVDLVSPGIHPKAGAIKDLAAGSVLITAAFALIVASVILLPKLLLYVA